MSGRLQERVGNFLRRADDESIRADVIGALFLLGALLSALTVILPHPNFEPAGVWVVVVLAGATGALLLNRSARMSTPQLHVAVALGSLLINALVVTTEVASGIYPAMFPWVVLVAVNFFRMREAAAHFVWLMGLYAVALALVDSASGFSPVTRWIIAAFALAVTGGATAWLVYRRRIAEQSRRRFLNLAEEMLCAVSPDDRFAQLNPVWGTRLGYTDEQLCSTPFTELVHPDDRESTEVALERLRNGMYVLAFENRLRKSDGRWLRLVWHAFYSPAERLVYARVVPVRAIDEKVADRSPLREAVAG